jgi:hypothetical protein
LLDSLLQERVDKPARMGGRSEDELEEVIASFKRIWRSGGRASLSLHASQGELEARLDLQLGSSPQDRLDERGENLAKTPTQLQIRSDQSLNSAKTPVQLQNSSNSTSSEESTSLIYEERRKGRSGPRLPLPLPARLPVPPYAEISKAPMCMDVPNTQVEVDQYENLSEYDTKISLIEEHTAQPGPDNPVLEKSSFNEVDEKIVDDATMEKTNPGRGFEEPLKRSNLRPEDLKAGQKCVAIAMGKIMHSPFPLMDKEEVEAVQRYLLADIGNISEIKITSLATEPEEDGLFLHQIQVKFTLDSAMYGTQPPTSLANHISQYEWLRRNQSIVRITDVHFKLTEEKSPLMKLCRKKK